MAAHGEEVLGGSMWVTRLVGVHEARPVGEAEVSVAAVENWHMTGDKKPVIGWNGCGAHLAMPLRLAAHIPNMSSGAKVGPAW